MSLWRRVVLWLLFVRSMLCRNSSRRAMLSMDDDDPLDAKCFFNKTKKLPCICALLSYFFTVHAFSLLGTFVTKVPREAQYQKNFRTKSRIGNDGQKVKKLSAALSSFRCPLLTITPLYFLSSSYYKKLGSTHN